MKNAESKPQNKKPSIKAQLVEANAKLEMARELWRMLPKGQARKIVLAYRHLSAANKAKATSIASHDAQVKVDTLHDERNRIVEMEHQKKFIFEAEVM